MTGELRILRMGRACVARAVHLEVVGACSVGMHGSRAREETLSHFGRIAMNFFCTRETLVRPGPC